MNDDVLRQIVLYADAVPQMALVRRGLVPVQVLQDVLRRLRIWFGKAELLPVLALRVGVRMMWRKSLGVLIM